MTLLKELYFTDFSLTLCTPFLKDYSSDISFCRHDLKWRRLLKGYSKSDSPTEGTSRYIIYAQFLCVTYFLTGQKWVCGFPSTPDITWGQGYSENHMLT